MSPTQMNIGQVHDAKLQEGFFTLWIWSYLFYDQWLWTFVERDRIKTVFKASVMDGLKYAMLCARPDICFIVGIMSGYQSIS